MDRRVAIKMEKARLRADPTRVKRILAEARALALLDHPNVIRILHADVDERVGLFIVMELLQDFGLAKFTNQSQESGEGMMVGTPRYMAPEQLRARVEAGSLSRCSTRRMLQDEQLEELADEAVAGFEKLLDAETLRAARHLFIDLYTAHPVMRALGTEHFGDRIAKARSEETDLRPFQDIEALRKKHGGG